MPAVRWLRAEGAVVAVALGTVWFLVDLSAWPTLVMLIAPDVALLAYLGGPRLGGVVYNLLHSYSLPALAVPIALRLDGPIMLAGALGWGIHIAVDRALGFGLKGATFKDTHLGRLG